MSSTVNSDVNNISTTTHSTSATKKNLNICTVCGDMANGMHYNALTCEGCKIFFRRQSRRQEQLKKCAAHVDTHDCMMDSHTRKQCSYCRMKKCLQVGMEIDRKCQYLECFSRIVLHSLVSPELWCVCVEGEGGDVDLLFILY